MQKIFAGGTEAFYTRGDKIHINDQTHYLVSGTVGLYSIEDKAKKFLLAYKTGEIFPYPVSSKQLFSGRKREYRALSHVSLLSMPTEDFKRVAFEPDHIKLFLESLMEVMELQIERIDNLEQGQVYSRLLERLNFLAKRLGVTYGDKIVIDAPMSHADIATSIGTSRETVNRLMKDLEKTGAIKVKSQTIIINSLDELNKLINKEDKKRISKNNGMMIAGVAALAAEGFSQLI